MLSSVEVAVPGGVLSVTDRGSGDPVLLHPSLGRPASDFDHLSRRLVAAGFRVLAVDPRCVGRSTGALADLTLVECAQDLARVADHCGLAQVYAVGHAFGNRVVRQLAIIRPDLVTRLVLLGAGGRFEGDDDARKALVRCFGPPEPQAEHLSAVRDAFFAPGNDPSIWAGGWHADAAAAQVRAAQTSTVEDWWEGGAAPMLVVQGLADRIAPPENARSLADDRPLTTLVELEGAGHALLPERPDAVADAVCAFLAQSDVAR